MAGKVATYEKIVLRLEEITAALSQKDITLEKSLSLYAEAANLIGAGEKLLREAELKMTVINEAMQAALPQEDTNGVQ